MNTLKDLLENERQFIAKGLKDEAMLIIENLKNWADKNDSRFYEVAILYAQMNLFEETAEYFEGIFESRCWLSEYSSWRY